MRNIFDQYTQPENRLTHSLATALHQDRDLLKDFLKEFGFSKHPPINTLRVIEQGLPGTVSKDDESEESQGLPDAIVFNEDGWALAIESKIDSPLTKDQLIRHKRTVQKCGFDTIEGLAITNTTPSFKYKGWHMIAWKDVYSWGHKHKNSSEWARHMIEYFNVAESKMIGDEYLTDGTITEFSGISFEPYTYLEAKRILKLLLEKLRSDNNFIDVMGLDPLSGRGKISRGKNVWDFISFSAPEGHSGSFTSYPHCTVGLGPDKVDAMITFPNALKAAQMKALCGNDVEDFIERVGAAAISIKKRMTGVSNYKPTMRLVQRRYASQKSQPQIDSLLNFDLRTVTGEDNPILGPSIKKQDHWARAAYEVLTNKASNVQMQIGVEFYDFDELNHKNVDKHFKDAFISLKPFVERIIR